MSESTLCSHCKIPLNDGGIEVFFQQQMAWKYDEEPTIEKPYQSRVCKKCLIGWNVPVQRYLNSSSNDDNDKQEKVWEFGVVESYDKESNMHNVKFIDDSSELVQVELDTFKRYIAHCTNMICLMNQNTDIAAAAAEAAATPATAATSAAKNKRNSTNDNHISTPIDMEYDPRLHVRRVSGLVGSPAGLLASPVGTPLKSELQFLPALRGGGAVSNNHPNPGLLEIPYLYHHSSPFSPVRKRQRISKPTSDVGFGRVGDHMVGNKTSATRLVSSSPLVRRGRGNQMIYSTWTPSSSTPTRNLAGNELTIITTGTPKQQKQPQRTWSPKEDNMLLQSIDATKNKNQVSWPQVAKMIPGRTGKQCRERYVNHLKPSLNLAKYWSPSEDAAIFSLFAKYGSKWSMMAKLISGRSDNSIKNRYNHLKRKFEKQIESMLLRHSKSNTQSSLTSPRLLPPLSVQVQNLANELKQQQNRLLPTLSQHGEFGNALLKYVAFEIIQKLSGSHNSSGRNNNQSTQLASSSLPSSPSSSSFYPTYRLPVYPGESCARCCLIVPSTQCGLLICDKSRWCENCCDILPCVSGDLLRKINSSYPAGATKNVVSRTMQWTNND